MRDGLEEFEKTMDSTPLSTSIKPHNTPHTRTFPFYCIQVRYSRLLEEGDFRGRTANFVYMILFGILHISVVASYLQVHFLGSALTFMMAYVWGRRNEHVRMSFLGFITFNAPYL